MQSTWWHERTQAQNLITATVVHEYLNGVMLSDRHTEVQKFLHELQNSKEIIRGRLIRPDGTIAFSTETQEVGRAMHHIPPEFNPPCWRPCGAPRKSNFLSVGLPETTLASRELGCPGQPHPADSAIPGCASQTCAEQGSAPRRRKIPTRAWRDLIKKVWDVDPLLCPKCGGQMRLISLIEEDEVIEKILRHLDLWEGPARPTERAPPPLLELGCVREPFCDDLPFGPDTYAE